MARREFTDKKNKLFSSVHFFYFSRARYGLRSILNIYSFFHIHSLLYIYVDRIKFSHHLMWIFNFILLHFHQIVNTFQGLLFKSEAF